MVRKRILLILSISLVLLMAAGVSLAATINIDASKTVGINPLIYGNNMNTGSGNDTDVGTGWGAWDPNGLSAKDGKSVQDVVDFAQDAGITILRFPGGCIAHQYHWLYGIGPYANRPTINNGTHGWIDDTDNKYGTDEHMAFAEDAGAEVMITVDANEYWDVDAGTNGEWVPATSREAAAWVAYLNGEVGDTNVIGVDENGKDWYDVDHWATLRGDPNYANHPAPYNVTYWEVDNEVWDNYDSVTEYIVDFNDFYTEMKKVDPTIKVGAVIAGRYAWQQTLIESLGDKTDFIIYHSYKPLIPKNQNITDPVDDIFRAVLAAPTQVQDAYTFMRNIIEISPGSSARAQDIELLITEFNTALRNEDPNYQHSIGTALNVAEMLNYLMVPDNKIGAANIWEFTSNVFGQVKGLTAPDYIVRPNQYVFEMYNYYFGSELVNTAVTSDTYESIDFYGAKAVTKYTAATGDATLRIRLQRDPGTNISGDIWYDDLVIRASGSDDNLLTNADFEDSPEFTGWTHSTDPQGVTSSIDNTVSRSDSNSFKLSLTAGNDPDYDANMYQDVAISSGTSYEIEGYIKTQGIAPALMNLLTNPGFEDGTTGWTFNTVTGATTTIDTTVSHNGSNSVKVVFDGTDVNYYHTVQTIDNIDPDLVYMLEGYIKTDNLTTTGSGVTLELSDDTGNSASTTFLPKVKGDTGGWVYISTNMLNPADNATQLKVRLRRYGGDGTKGISGTARWDDLRVQALPKYYVPNIEVDVLDSLGGVNKTITLDGVLGTRDWLKRIPDRTQRGTPYLSAVASKDASGNLYLMVINKDNTNDITTQINISGYVPPADVPVWTLEGGSAFDANNEIVSNVVKVNSSSITGASANFSYTFPARSLTAIAFGLPVPAPEPIGLWKMDETSGSWNGTAGEVFDSSTAGLDNSGYAYNPNSTGPLPNTITDTERGQVGSFPGGDSVNGAGLVYIPGNSSQDITGDLTIAGWVNMDIAGNNHILSKAANQAYKLHLSNGQIKLTLWDTAGVQQPYADPNTGLTPIPAGQWHHIAAVADFTAGNVYFYLDGSLSGTVALAQTAIQTNTWVLTIGAATDLGHGAFDGLLDEVRLYNAALTAGQIAEVYGVIDTNAPAAPTNLTATAGDAQVSLNWDDNTESDLAGYNVYRSQTTGGPYTKLNTSLVSTSDYVDATVTNDTTYYYVVTAVDNASNESGYSNEDSATPTDTTPPANPTTLTATAGDAQVSLDWDDNTETDLAGYNVYRSQTTGGPYTKLNTSLVTTSDYVDTTVTNDTTYYYVVTAVDTSSNESGYSNEASATPTAPDTTPPANPTNLAATAGDGQVSLNWDDNTETDLAGYNVYRSQTTGGPYTKLNTSLVSTSDYVDTTVTNDTTYYYVVTAVDTSSNESGYSNEDSATPTDTTPPANPTSLAATAGDAQVSLDWADNTETDMAGYNVYRSQTTGGPYTKLNTSLVTTSDYLDTTVTNGTTYYYVVTAVDNSSNESGYSNEAFATPQSVVATDDVANSDIAVSGTVSGSYIDTQSSNNVNESIKEVSITTGRPSGRKSYLEHKWTINVTGGSTVTFYIEAYHTANSEGDDFNFAYSTDGGVTYTYMLTVTKTSDDNTPQSYVLPNSTSGTVYIRVLDTDQTSGNTVADTIYVDHMYIRSE